MYVCFYVKVDALPNLSLGVVVNAYLNKTNNNNSNGEKKPVNLLGGSIKFQRLPLIAYDLLGDEKLIELVRQVGFNTNGYSREFLITLHSEYTEQYNAKIDSGVRETPNGEEIRKNVLASNRLLSSKKSTPPSSSVSSFFSSSLVTANKRNLASSETGGNSTLAVKEIRKRRKIEQSQWTWQRTSNEWRAVWSDKLNGILYWNDKTNEVTTEKPPREKDEENNNKHDDAARYIVIINDDDDLTQ